MNTADLNELIAQIEECHSLTTLFELQRQGINKIKAAKLNWLKDLYFNYRFYNAIFEKTDQLQPKHY